MSSWAGAESSEFRGRGRQSWGERAAVGLTQQGEVMQPHPAATMVRQGQCLGGEKPWPHVLWWAESGPALGFGPEAVRHRGTGSDGDIWLDKQTHLKSELQISLTKTKLELLNGLNQCLLLYFFFCTKCSVC